MENLQLLDVTLRDGGYKTNFNYTDNQLSTILKRLDNSGIEYIEVGYKNGSLNPISGIGNAGLCDADYLTFCRRIIKRAKIAVMLHPKNISMNSLYEIKATAADMIRICLPQGTYHSTIPVIDKSKELGFDVSVNITRMSHYSETELDELMGKLSQHNIDVIYFADSNGSMLPTKIKSLYQKYARQMTIPLGFHAHDNLGLAQANTIAAMKAGASFVDVSLAGFGKGIGNLKAELFIAYLQAMNNNKYNIQEVLLGSNYVRSMSDGNYDEIGMDEIMMGIDDLSIDDIKKRALAGYSYDIQSI